MNEDGTPGIGARVDAGARLPFLTALGWSTVGGALLFLGGGIALIVAGARRRPPAPRGEVGPPPPPPPCGARRARGSGPGGPRRVQGRWAVTSSPSFSPPA